MITFKEYLDEMALTRYAVVDEKGKPHFISDDEKSADRVASKTPGYTVRKIFAPRKRKDDVIPVKDIERKLNENSGPGAMQIAEINNKQDPKLPKLFHFGEGEKGSEYGYARNGKYIATHRHNPETGNVEKLDKPITYSKIDRAPEHPATAHDMTDKSFKSIGRGSYKRIYSDEKNPDEVTTVAGLGAYHGAPRHSKLADIHHIIQCKKNQEKPEHERDKHLPIIGDYNLSHPDIVQAKMEKLHDDDGKYHTLHRIVASLHNKVDEMEHHTGNPLYSRDKSTIQAEIDGHKKSIQNEIDKHPELQKHNSAESIHKSLADLCKQRRLANKSMGVEPGNPLKRGDGIAGDLHSGNIMHAIDKNGNRTLKWSDPHVSQSYS